MLSAKHARIFQGPLHISPKEKQDTRQLTFYASDFATLLPLHFEVASISKPIRLIFSVPPVNVASRVWLKIPWRNQNNIAFSYPHSPLQLATNSAQSFFPVLAFHHNPLTTQHPNSHTQNVVSTRQQHIFKVPFIRDFSFTHLPTPNHGVVLAAHSFTD
jgi:hypothetical protein